MGSKPERLQRKYDRLTDKSEKDGSISTKEAERLATVRASLDETQKIEEEVVTSETHAQTHEVQKEVQKSISLDQLLSTATLSIGETRRQLRFAKRGEGKEVRHVVKHINDRLDKAQDIIDKNERYANRFADQDMRQEQHINAMIAKIVTILSNSQNYLSQTLTGDIDEAKRFFPPNVFDDASYYIPDAQPHETRKRRNNKAIEGYTGPILSNKNTSPKDYPGRKEALGEGGIIGGLNRVGSQTNMTLGQRKMFSNLANLGVTAGIVFGGYKIAKDIWGLLRGTKKFGFAEKDKDGKIISEGTPWLTGLVGGSLLTTMTLGKWPWQVVTEVAKGGETTRKIHGRLAGMEDNPGVSDDIKEGIGHAMNVNTAIGLIPFMDLTKSGILTFDDNKPTVDKDKLDAYINSDYAKSKYTSQDLENMRLGLTHYNETSLGKAFQQMHIDADVVENNPNDLPSKYFMKYTEELAKKGEAVDTETDGTENVNTKGQIDAIKQQMTQEKSHNLVVFRGAEAMLRKELSALYNKHPKARPIKITYNATTKTFDLTTYGETTRLDILSGKYIVSTPYTETAWSATSLSEAIRVSNLINFLTSTYTGASELDAPFNKSRDGVSADIEFERKGNRESFIQGVPHQGMDITILNDSFFSSTLEDTYPSVNDNKGGFIDFLNSFHGDNNESLWNKNSTAFKEIRALEEKFRTQYGINYTNDIEKEARKMSGLLKALGFKYEGLTNHEYGEALVAIDQTLSKFPPKLLQKTKLDYLELSKNADLNGSAYGKADAVTLKLLGGSIDIDIKGVQGINHLIAHEYTHNLIYKNNKIIEKRPTLELTSLDNLSLDTLGYITPYGSVSAEEDMCEIAGVLFNGGAVSKEYQKEFNKYNWNGNLFERIKIDSTLLKKVELFTGCKVDPNNSDMPFTRTLTQDERKTYGFEGPAFFSKRCSDAGVTTDHHYRNNLKKNSIS